MSALSSKTLFVNPTKCNGCKDCEGACSAAHIGPGEPDAARIQVLSFDGDDGFYLPATCQQCEDPPCVAVCPNDALTRDAELNMVKVERNLCVGCKMCTSACPTGVMGFDNLRGIAFKCDLCGGRPECVRVCEPGAIEYTEPQMYRNGRVSDSANKLRTALRRAAC